MKKFYSFLFSACCVVAAFTMFSCTDPNEEDLEKKEDGKVENKIEYIKFKEPYLVRESTEDDIKAWMAKNMPEYELNHEITSSLYYFQKGSKSNVVLYGNTDGKMVSVAISGCYKIDDVLSFLDSKYGDREFGFDEVHSGVTYEEYSYHVDDSQIKLISVVYEHGILDIRNLPIYEIQVSYIFQF